MNSRQECSHITVQISDNGPIAYKNSAIIIWIKNSCGRQKKAEYDELKQIKEEKMRNEKKESNQEIMWGVRESIMK